MTTYVNLKMPTTRGAVLRAADEAYALGDRNIVISLDGIVNHIADWDTSVRIYGNHGELVVARTGEVLLYDRTEDVDNDAIGYGDIVHVELDQWRVRHGFEWSEVGRSIDILMVAFHTKDGTHEPAVNA